MFNETLGLLWTIQKHKYDVNAPRLLICILIQTRKSFRFNRLSKDLYNLILISQLIFPLQQIGTLFIILGIQV